jgi:hypothetical protein
MAHLRSFWIWIWILASIPVTYAMPEPLSPFPDVTFKSFSQFILQHFGSKISLSTVLVILFSLTENTDLLNLHARQQYAQSEGEKRVAASGWMNCLSRALTDTINEKQKKPLKMKLVEKDMDEEQTIKTFGLKLDGLARVLKLHPYDNNGKFQGKLKTVSHHLIKPVHIICPQSMECGIDGCNGRSLLQNTKTRDIPQVTLIKNSVMYDDVFVLTGQCPKCSTIYHADHDWTLENKTEKKFGRLYLNSAKYLKVGQSMWVDRLFGIGVLNGMYSFHASAAAYTEYWNNTIWKHQPVKVKKITRRQVWQAFVQESIRNVATTIGEDLFLPDGLAINEVTQKAFEILGEQGRIRPAVNHECSECAQEYRKTSDIVGGHNPAATVGADEDDEMLQDQIIPDPPPLTGQDLPEIEVMDIDSPTANKALVTMAVLDGIVMGPPVCLNCSLVK